MYKSHVDSGCPKISRVILAERIFDQRAFLVFGHMLNTRKLLRACQTYCSHCMKCLGADHEVELREIILSFRNNVTVL